MKDFINPAISPNVQLVDLLEVIKRIFSPFSLKNGGYIARVESWFKYNFSVKYAFTFSSAREAEYALLLGLGIKKGDEVLVQAFTCVAAVRPVLWLGAKPVYVDIEKNTLSANPEDILKKITPQTKAIIVQHTFGIPARIDEIKKIAKEHKLYVIEDCAHVVGGYYKNKKLGTFGDAAFFSFGRDKSVSSVFGGIAITNRTTLADKLKRIRELSPYPSTLWIYQQLFHPLITYFVITGFRLHETLGKALLFFFKNIHLISRPILASESNSFLGKSKVKRYPNALAALALTQLVRLNSFNKKRVELYTLYKKNLESVIEFPSADNFYLRIPIFLAKHDKLIKNLKAKNIYLGDWYSHVIDSGGTNFDEIQYKKGSCPEAERLAKLVVNLPSYPRMNSEEVEKISKTIILLYGKKRPNLKSK